jgi:hypothetical protein
VNAWAPVTYDAPSLGFNSLPDNFTNGKVSSSIVIPGSIIVYGFVAYSTKGSAQFLNVFDLSSVPADTAVPLFSWPLAANNGVGVSYAPNGRWFKEGIVLCNSSTDATKTIGSADCLFDVQWNMLEPVDR